MYRKPKNALTSVLFIFALLTFMIGGNAYAYPITINNASFETPDLIYDGNFIFGVTGWTTLTGESGTWRPNAAYYKPYDPNTYYYTASNGNNVAAVFDNSSISQTLTSQLTAGTTYKLSVDVGRYNDTYYNPNYTVALLAGSNILASGGYVQPADGQFATLTLNYTAGTNYLGQNLAIQLIGGPAGEGLHRIHFDNVNLTATPPSAVPLPPGLLLLGPGLMGLVALRRKIKI